MSAAQSLDEQSWVLRATRADAAVESAMPGWVGRSAAVLAAAAVDWAETLAMLADRLFDQSEALRVAAWTFAEMDAAHARAVAAAGEAR